MTTPETAEALLPFWPVLVYVNTNLLSSMPLDIPIEVNDKESFMTTLRLATTAIAAMGPKSTLLSLLIWTSRPTWPCHGQGTWLKVCWCMAAFMAVSSSFVKNSPFSLRTVEPMSVSLKKRSKMPQRHHEQFREAKPVILMNVHQSI